MKKKSHKKVAPKQGELPGKLTLDIIKAWKHLTRRLADEGILDEQREEKGMVWRVLTYVPNTLKKYQIVKNTRKLYQLDEKEYEILKALTNAYGVYDPEGYNPERPMVDITKSKIRRMERELEDSLDDLAA